MKLTRQIGMVFLASGLVLVTIILLLFYGLTEPETRSATFSFTLWIIIFQVASFSGVMAFTAFQSESRMAVPVRMSYMTIVGAYNGLSILTILFFNLFLLPDVVSPKTYYVIMIAELLLAVSLLILINVVGLVDQGAHAEGIAKRTQVQDLADVCESISAAAKINGSNLDQAVRELQEKIRFSEGLRKNDSLLLDAFSRLQDLCALVEGGLDDTRLAEAKKKLMELGFLVSRKA
jgi:hypothetical protein